MDIFDGFCWHSSIGIDSNLDGNKRFVTRMPLTASTRSMFAVSGDLLIHKTTKCLWRMSKDGTSIEPVFNSDILTEEEVEEAMKGV